MIAGLGFGLLDRTRFQAPPGARATAADGVSPTPTRDPTCCFRQVVLEARE